MSTERGKENPRKNQKGTKTMKYEVRVWNHKTLKVEILTVDAAGLKKLYWSVWFDILDVWEAKS